MANNSLRVAIVSGLMLLVSVPAAANYLEDMDTLQAQIDLVNRRAQLQSALRGASEAVSLPKISSIMRSGSQATAQLAFSNGLIRWVRVGDIVGDGVTVHAIARDQVLVRVNGRRVALNFQGVNEAGAAGAAEATVLSMSAPSIALPPLPPSAVPVTRAPATSGPAAVGQ